MIETVNSTLQNKPKMFKKVTSANVLIVYIYEIFDGCKYLPSLIGIPKIIFEQQNCKNMVRESPPDYSCVKFYTPFRNKIQYKDQPLRLWFADDKEQVTFGIDENQYNIYIYKENEHDRKNLSGVISRPDIVLLDLKQISHWVITETSLLIKDYLIMTNREIDPQDVIVNTCKNIVDPHEHKKNNNATTTSNCVIS